MKGGGAPKRRNCPVGPRHAADVAIHLRFGRRPRVQRNALAFRRSTAALTEVSRPRLFDFRPGFLGRGSARALPALSCPSPAAAPRAPAVIPVDMMPEAARERTVSVRARAPRPLCAIRSTLMMASLRPAGGGLISKYRRGRQACDRRRDAAVRVSCWSAIHLPGRTTIREAMSECGDVRRSLFHSERFASAAKPILRTAPPRAPKGARPSPCRGGWNRISLPSPLTPSKAPWPASPISKKTTTPSSPS
jgi:hypothetical protein